MDFANHIRRLWSRVQSIVTRGVVTRVNDDRATQTIQIELRAGELADAVEHFQPFGVSFHPPLDSEAVVLATGAAQDNLVAVVVTDRQTRPTAIQEGEGGLYTPSGWKVFCNEDDEVHLTTKAASQSFLRGEEVKSALDSYQDAVATAIGTIKISGDPGSDTGTIAKATTALNIAGSQLVSAIDAALSTKLKGE